MVGKHISLCRQRKRENWSAQSERSRQTGASAAPSVPHPASVCTSQLPGASTGPRASFKDLCSSSEPRMEKFACRSHQRRYQPRLELPRNWPHITSFVWVESKGAVAHRLETLSVKSSLALSVKRKLVQKETMGWLRQALLWQGAWVRDLCRALQTDINFKSKVGRRLLPSVCPLTSKETIS